MDFKEHVLGVKIKGSLIAIEPADPFGDTSRYDFFFTDFVSDNYNGNVSYGCKLSPLDDGKKYVEINGWKIKKMSFPGNWYGQWGICELEDGTGRTTNVTGAAQSDYDTNYLYMIRETLSMVKDFVNENPCVEYKEIMKGIELPSSKVSIDKLRDFLTKAEDYITKYKRLKDNFSEDEAEKYSEKMRDAVSNNLKKCFNIEIEID